MMIETITKMPKEWLPQSMVDMVDLFYWIVS